MQPIKWKSHLTFALICQSLLLLIIIQGNSDGLLLSHGEFCNETLHCNQSKLLTCQESICDCILADSMTFSDNVGHCVSLSEEACGLISIIDTSDVLLQCIDQAFCNNQGYCQCHTGFFRNDQGVCLRQMEFGEACTFDGECSQELGLACVNRTCNCNRAVSIDNLKFGTLFQEDEHRCLGRADYPCLNSHCVPNALCKESVVVQHPESGTSGVLENICTCQSGFEPSSKKKGICLATFNKTCDFRNNLLCQKGLSCLDGLCQCPYPRSQIYNRETKKCQSLVGGPCEHSENTKEDNCVANSICKKQSSSGVMTFDHSFCECDEGFVENVNRRCDIAYGQSCPYESSTCDQLSGLRCKDGFCLCSDSGQIFDKGLMKCRGAVGAHCLANNGVEKDYCVQHAFCETNRNGLLPHGHCKCNEDYEIADDLTCSCDYCDDEGRSIKQ